LECSHISLSLKQREPYSKTVAHIIPRLQWDYKRKTEENNQLEEIIGKHSEENRQILHDKHRQQLSAPLAGSRFSVRNG
jgi:hypothetical protein